MLSDPIAIKLRIEQPLLRRIQAAAKEELRSANSEINRRLQLSFEHRSGSATTEKAAA